MAVQNLQNEKKIEAILRQVQKELLIDIADAKRIFNVFIKKDSLARKIIDDKVTVEMFIENPRKFRITYEKLRRFRYLGYRNSK